MTTQIRNLALEPHPYGEIIAGALVAAGLGFAGWVVRIAMGETLRGIRDALAGVALGQQLAAELAPTPTEPNKE